MKYPLLFLILSATLLSAKKPCELWWEETLDKNVSMETFRGWLGDAQTESRVKFRRHLRDKGYTNMLDAACGLCIDYWGIQQDKISIDYTGVDVTEKLVTANCARGINVVNGSIEKIPFPDNTFEITYGRHILEHLEGYKKALSELIRCAKKETLITFFLNPTNEHMDKYSSDIVDGYQLYHNTYSKQGVEHFVLGNPKVDRIEWELVGEREEYLHIYLK